MHRAKHSLWATLGFLALATTGAVGEVSNFVKTLGGSADDTGYGIVGASDGGFALTGATASYGAGADDLLLAKYDSDGTLTWAEAIGGTRNDNGFKIIEASNGNLVVTGSTYSFGQGSNDFVLARFLDDGTLSWAKVFGGSYSDEEGTVIEASDGHLVFTGKTYSYTVGKTDCLLANFFPNGTLSWARTIGGDDFDLECEIMEQDNGHLALTGATQSFDSGNYDILLAQFLANGTLSWAKTIGSSQVNRPQTAVKGDDNSFVVAGYSSGYDSTYESHLFLAKVFFNGTLSWAKTWGNVSAEYGVSIEKMSDGSFVATGQTTPHGQGLYDLLVIRVLANGTLAWAKTWGNTGDEFGYSIAAASDNVFWITGSTESYGSGAADALLAKIGIEGTTCSNAFNTSLLVATDLTDLLSVTTISPEVAIPSITIYNMNASVTSITPNETTICETAGSDASAARAHKGGIYTHMLSTLLAAFLAKYAY